MQLLDYLLATFSPKNDLEFKKWIKNQGPSVQDIRLFIALRKYGHQGWQVVAKKAFDNPITLEAYSSARRRLNGKVMEYVVSVINQEDPTQISKVVSHILLALHCLAHKQEPAVVEFLKRAEDMARTNKQLSLLDEILYLRIKHAELLGVDVAKAVSQWEENNKHLMEFRRIEIAFAEIRTELHQAKQKGSTLDVDRVVHDVFNRFNITRQQASDPEAMMRLIGIGRAAYISVKEYRKIEPFIERFYFRFKKANAFTAGLSACEMDYLSLLAHTYYRNRKFDKANEMLAEMKKRVDKSPILAAHYQPRMVSIKAGVLCYTGSIDKAIEAAQKALRLKSVKENEAEQINLQLNLAVYFFCAKKYKEALAQLKALPKDEVLLSKKGQEWTIKKQMIEMIVLCEKGDEDKALALVTRILKSYEDVWDKPLFSVTHAFLKFALQIFTGADVATDAKFKAELNRVRISTNNQQHDIQVISFYCWLKVRAFGGDYYKLLLERIGR